MNKEKSANSETILKNSENNNIYHIKHAKSNLARCYISKNARIFSFKKVQ